MKYEAFIKNDQGEIKKSFKGEMVNLNQFFIVSENFRMPRSFGIKNVEGNEDIYNKLLYQVGNTLRVDSNEIKGLFSISMDKEEEIVLKEVFE